MVKTKERAQDAVEQDFTIHCRFAETKRFLNRLLPVPPTTVNAILQSMKDQNLYDSQTQRWAGFADPSRGWLIRLFQALDSDSRAMTLSLILGQPHSILEPFYSANKVSGFMGRSLWCRVILSSNGQIIKGGLIYVTNERNE